MAYFGRKPKKPGSVPGSQSGNVQKERLERVQAAVRRAVSEPRAERAGRALRTLRNARTARSGR